MGGSGGVWGSCMGLRVLQGLVQGSCEGLRVGSGWTWGARKVWGVVSSLRGIFGAGPGGRASLEEPTGDAGMGLRVLRGFRLGLAGSGEGPTVGLVAGAALKG